MKKIIIMILIATMLVGCKKSAKDVNIIEIGLTTKKEITYNDLYRNFDNYSWKDIQCQVTLIEVDKSISYEYFGDSSFYKIYGYVGNNKNDLVKLKMPTGCTQDWNVRPGDIINVVGKTYFFQQEYNDGTKIPTIEVEIDKCTFIN